ncbi:MAG TPA: SRPBCC family protein [Burkholderiales bacterium]|jgi:carbon monoxide dehydrogenase subunit G|nr:SRPBCC family protein [Burkholderiales bacterium]
MQPRIPSVTLLSVLFVLPAQAAQTDVSVSKSGGLYLVQATSAVAADRVTVWQVLTDYAGYRAFVPDLKLSRLIGDVPRRVEQKGEFGILFFAREVSATLEIEEYPPSRILFRAIAGDLRRLDTEVTIEDEGARRVVRYRSSIEPDFWVPPLIGTSLVRLSIRRKLQAVAEEMERRADLAGKK